MSASKGQPHPLGVTLARGGANFSLYSRGATKVELLLFETRDAELPARVIALDPHAQRTYHYWHVFVPGVKAGQAYGYRVHGPRDPARGLRFDPEKLLLDPYGRALHVPRGYRRGEAAQPGAHLANAPRNLVVDLELYDWEDDQSPRRPASQTVIYELHVRGFTRHPSSGVPESSRGTYAGLREKIPYLVDLGITAVELMPVFAFDAQDAPAGRTNYWGYAPLSFFAPHAAYAASGDPLGALDELRDLVKALHRAGLEVLLDVVFNHSAEGPANGPVLSFRGIDDATYYLRDADGIRYADHSGTGNTLNAGHPVVRRLIVDSLRAWVRDFHIDGFRFDLASILARDERGRPLSNPPLLWDIESDPALAGVKLIAEAWDAGGLYQVGSFVGDAWREWNGRFRDDARDFFRGELGAPGSARRFADRLIGSPEIYGHEEREPEQSINFVTCHDGFTLNDLVSYERKYNEANGEGNRDGTDDHRSWNCGVEGPSEDPAVEALRARQIRNFLAATLLSLGVPMLLMGDEMRRTQRGNNNAFGRDDETSWLDWSLLERHADLHRFVRLLLERRTRRSDALERERASLNHLIRNAEHRWHGVELEEPDWSESSHSFAFGAKLRGEKLRLHFCFNAWRETLDFALPAPHRGPGGWRRWIDTARPSPADIVPWQEAPSFEGARYRVEPHSFVALYAREES
ncbi:MAG: glycogen debranching protein GlgX [Planctomycetes bacterium]|nr:glycogen debranching protein GlgX [Planctomycetota bacterium]